MMPSNTFQSPIDRVKRWNARQVDRRLPASDLSAPFPPGLSGIAMARNRQESQRGLGQML
jgi:hypothetical protein